MFTRPVLYLQRTPECTKAHLPQSKISKFFRAGGPPDPPFWRGKQGRKKWGRRIGEGERKGKGMNGLEGKGKGQGMNGSVGRKGGATPNKNLPLHH